MEKAAILHGIIRGEVRKINSLEAINNRRADVSLSPSERLSGASKRNCAPLRTRERFVPWPLQQRGSVAELKRSKRGADYTRGRRREGRWRRADGRHAAAENGARGAPGGSGALAQVRFSWLWAAGAGGAGSLQASLPVGCGL